MIKQKICIDLDDTVWEFHKPFFEFYSKVKNVNVSYKDFKVYSLREFFEISKEEEIKLFESYEETDLFDKPVFLNNFKKALPFLVENFEIHFVTARHEGIKKKTINILNKNFNFPFEVFFTRDKNHEEIKSKKDYCLENGIKLIIEDKLETLEECVEEGIKGILMDSPWNQKKDLNKNIFRVRDWDEVLEILKNGN